MNQGEQQQKSCAPARLRRMRAKMAEAQMPDFYCRDLSNVKWLTAFEGVFDDEAAHAAFVTPGAALLHTDSRYAAAAQRAACGGEWQVSEERATHAAWIAQQFASYHERKGSKPGANLCSFGIEDTIALREFRQLEQEFSVRQYAPVLVETDGFVNELRAVKDAQEIAALRAAQTITDAAFEHIVGFMREGMTELEIKIELEETMRRLGAEGLAFDSIVASGENGASPHAIAGSRRLQAGDMVVLDFGARKGGYCSDMTRTVCVGQATPQARAVFAAVREANETVEALLEAGVTGAAAHEHAEAVLERYGFAGKMGHGLGHGVGLDIHELPNLSPRNAAPLAVGNVVTVEPGVYLEGALGCRLEDFGVITENGFEVFTKSTHELVII